MRHLRVAVTASSLDPTWGGAQRYAAELSSTIAELGVDVTILCAGKPDSAYVRASKNLTLAYLDTHSIGRLFGLSFPGMVLANSLRSRDARRMRNSLHFQVVHDSDLGSMPDADVATAQQCSMTSTILSMSNMKPFWADDWKHLALAVVGRQPFMYPMYEGSLARKYRLIITPSEMVRRGFRNHYRIPEERMALIPHGVDPERFKPNSMKRASTRSRLGVRDEEFLVCFCGWDFTRKGLSTALKAVARLKKARMVILGRSILPKYYVDLCEKLRILDKVRALSTSTTEDYYSASDALAFPSLFDAFGLAALEAMACALPVVASPTAGVAELVEDGVDGLVLKSPLDHEELAACLGQLQIDESLRRAISNNARKKAMNFSWKRVAKKVIDAYEMLT